MNFNYEDGEIAYKNGTKERTFGFGNPLKIIETPPPFLAKKQLFNYFFPKLKWAVEIYLFLGENLPILASNITESIISNTLSYIVSMASS